MLSSHVINKRHGLMRVCHTFSEYLLRAAVAFSNCERVRARRLQTISNQVWPRTAAKQFKSMADNFTTGIVGRYTQEAFMKGKDRDEAITERVAMHRWFSNHQKIGWWSTLHSGTLRCCSLPSLIYPILRE